MVSSISLGNFSTQNGRTVVTGSSSGGLDTKALLEALTAAKRLPAVKLEETIDKNTEIAAAYSELQQLLGTFKDAANFLRNPPGVANQIDNIFEYRGATVTNNGAIAGSTYMTVNAEPGADTGNYSVKINALATNNTKITNTFALADTDTAVAVDGGGPFNSGAFTVGASGVSVTLDNNDTLQDVVDKINGVKSQSGVSASIIQIGTGQYRVSLKTIDTGAAENYATPATAIGWAVETNAVDASIEVDGTTVTRSTNSISDVVDGLTFNLLAATPVTDTLTVGVNADTELVKNAIFSFVESYNELRIFAAKQGEVGTDGLPKEGALLGQSATMRNIVSSVTTEVSNIVDGLGAGVANKLADIGITMYDFPGDAETPEVRNLFTINETKLNSAIASKFEEVRDIFEFDYGSDDPDLVIFSRTNSLNATQIQLTIDQTNGVYTAMVNGNSVNLTGTAVPGGGLLLEGADGSDLDGLVLIYNNTGDATVNVNLSQGIGDRVYNALDAILETDTGALEVELNSISEKSERMQKEIDRIDSVVERYREQLLQQFSALEAAIASANVLLQSLQAQSDARLAAS